MGKREIIDAIMRLNRSARLEFLAEFTERELLDYLEHLHSIPNPMEQVVEPAMVA
jgi:hypothetical protein